MATLLESRIRRGDYAVRPLPTEQELAEEVGVSRSTARQAFQCLIDKGLLERHRHGRLSVRQQERASAA